MVCAMAGGVPCVRSPASRAGRRPGARPDSEQEFDAFGGRGWSVKWFDRLRASLGKARDTFSAVARLGRPGQPLTPEFWDELEEALILADVGVPTTQKILT